MPKKSYVTVTDQFCGAGGSSLGAVHAGCEVVLAMNHWELAIETHNTNFPDTTHVLADISQVDPRRYPSTDILITSPECFPVGTLILTGRGLVPIENVTIGDRVLTHRNRWMPVTAVMTKYADTIIVKGHGHMAGLEVTANHPFYVRRQYQRWSNQKRDYNRHLYYTPAWREAYRLLEDKCRWATPVRIEELPVPEIPDRAMPMYDPEFWWMVGRWLADGTVRQRPEHGGEITISCGQRKVAYLEEKLSRWEPAGKRAGDCEIRWRQREIRTATLFETGYSGLAHWLVEHFGRHAHGKTMPAWALSLPQDCRQGLLDGYVSGDGSVNDRYTSCSTVSKSLAVGVRLLAESLGFRVGLYRYSNKRANCIEGRKVCTRDAWVIRWENNKSKREAFDDGDHSWLLVKGIRAGRQDVQVFNLSVAEDESYVADGIVVHNCTNHSLAKGQKRKNLGQLPLFGDYHVDPAAERSRATMWDVPRFAEFHNYEIIIVENVVDARYWRLFDAWIHAMQLLDYDFGIVYFNSMFAHPTPQSRDRMYVVFWKRGNRRPDLTITPKAWCHQCGQDVDAFQSWKKGTPWGRYRKQYVYRCPHCLEEVEPYYYAAANAIDWTDPGQRIGDRDKPLKPRTLERVRYGLEKFGAAPAFTQVDYSHSDSPRTRPVTDALPTQSTRQAFALSVPQPFILGYYTRANPAVNSVDEALPTQSAQPRHYLVQSMPFFIKYYSGAMNTKPITDPLGAVTTWDHHGLVQPQPYIVELRNHSKAREITAALATVTAGGGHHGLVMPQPFLTSYYGSAKGGTPVTDPVNTVTTVDRHGLVIPDDELRVEDCYFRMLKPEEIGQAMAFPEEYVVKGNKRDRVRQYGNAVTPPVMSLLIDRCVATLAG